jgi:hypothetical protein
MFADVTVASHALRRTRLRRVSLECLGHALRDRFIFEVRVKGSSQRPIVVRIVAALLLQDIHNSI